MTDITRKRIFDAKIKINQFIDVMRKSRFIRHDDIDRIKIDSTVERYPVLNLYFEKCALKHNKHLIKIGHKIPIEKIDEYVLSDKERELMFRISNVMVIIIDKNDDTILPPIEIPGGNDSVEKVINSIMFWERRYDIVFRSDATIAENFEGLHNAAYVLAWQEDDYYDFINKNRLMSYFGMSTTNILRACDKWADEKYWRKR